PRLILRIAPRFVWEASFAPFRGARTLPRKSCSEVAGGGPALGRVGDGAYDKELRGNPLPLQRCALCTGGRGACLLGRASAPARGSRPSRRAPPTRRPGRRSTKCGRPFLPCGARAGKAHRARARLGLRCPVCPVSAAG